jgi:hypothetical protein
MTITKTIQNEAIWVLEIAHPFMNHPKSFPPQDHCRLGNCCMWVPKRETPKEPFVVIQRRHGPAQEERRLARGIAQRLYSQAAHEVEAVESGETGARDESDSG